MAAREYVARSVSGALAAIAAGARPRDLESAVLDFKEYKAPAANDRDPLKAGALDLAEALACLATGRGGAVVVEVDDDIAGPAAFVGLPPEVDADDLRHRIWQLTSPSLVVGAEPKKAGGVDLLVLTAEPGFDLHRVGGRLRERIADHCEPMTPEREAAVRDERRNFDWSGQTTELGPESVLETSIEEARRLLEQAGPQPPSGCSQAAAAPGVARVPAGRRLGQRDDSDHSA